ncbi:hypothetical protein TIFTF001_018623 [Ficus carica]|uniref:Uncharacterized protein n=1 Tax=Ficus carica TaxID=3494 RepID=A0AA88A4Q8_FICCA|nr:hypothetical protein TIFTF001_018623 [Ficus carica]
MKEKSQAPLKKPLMMRLLTKETPVKSTRVRETHDAIEVLPKQRRPLGNHPLRQFGPHPPTTTSPKPPATIPSGEPIHRGLPPTQLRASYFPTHRRIASSPASRVAEEETEEETEPLEAPPFSAVTALMGTRLRSLEEEEERGGGGGHGDGVPDGDGGGGGFGRELGRL